MCPPEHFAVTYAINPWMDPAQWSHDARALAATAQNEWERLRGALRDLGATIELVAPLPGLPDLVFTANSAVVLDRKALLARFRHRERQLEEPPYASAFDALRTRGLIDETFTLPAGIVLEGAGDCVWDKTRGLFWMGYGQRSDASARRAVEAIYGVETLALELVDPRFYHLDTALCPLPRGEIMYVPEAFSVAGRDVIASNVSSAQRIEVAPDDACRLAANCVALGDALVLSACGDFLRENLRARGYRVIETGLSAFRRSGGAAFCLTLRLDCSTTLALADPVAVGAA